MTQEQNIAVALRAAADHLDRAKQLVKGLSPRHVDDESALALWLDSPKVIHALYNVAGSLDPEGTEEDELVGELFNPSPARRVKS